MTYYTFKAYNKAFVTNTKELAGFDAIMDLGAAMSLANEKLLWATDEAKEGSWVLNSEETLDGGTNYTYYWEEVSSLPLCGGIIAD